MNIQKVNFKNNCSFLKKQDLKETKDNNFGQSYNNTMQNLAYPASYYLNFTGQEKKTIGELYDKRDTNGMPTLVAKYIDEKSKNNKAILSRYDIGAVQKEVFSGLKDCHTVDDVIKRYGDSERCLMNIKKLEEIKKGTTRAATNFYDIAQAQLNKEITLPNKDELPVYIAKKMFLECKSYKDIVTDLKDYIKENYPSFEFCLLDNESIGKDYFTSLGIDAPNGLSYGIPLRRGENQLSDSEKISKKFIDTRFVTPEQLEEYKRDSLAMMIAWNNSSEIKADLSKFLFENAQSPAFSIKNEDFTDIETLNCKFTDFYFRNRMATLMEEFWDENPEYAAVFGVRISKAYDEYDAKKASEPEKMEEYEAAIYKKAQEERGKVLELRSGYIDPYQTAKEALMKWLEKAKPLRINTDETNKIIVNLLFLRGELSKKEVEALQGSVNNPLFVKLVTAKKGEGGLIEKMGRLSDDTTYRRLLNAQSFAIMQTLLETGTEKTKEYKDALQNGQEINNYTKRLVKGKLSTMPADFSIENATKLFDKCKATLSKKEQVEILRAFYDKYDFLSEQDAKNIQKLLSVQGKYLNAVLEPNSDMADIAETIFWSEYQRMFNEDFLPKVNEVRNKVRLHEDKKNYIDMLDWSSIIKEAFWIS